MRICFVGDIAPGSKLTQIHLTGKYDLIIGNLEAPVLPPDSKINQAIKAGPTLRSSPDLIISQNENEISNWIFNLANNHSMDFGIEGIQLTQQFIESSGHIWIGFGNNLHEARKPHLCKVGEHEVAILTCADSGFGKARIESPGFPAIGPWVTSEILKQKQLNRIVIVLYHGGSEDDHLPSPNQVETFRNWSKLGADVIVGTHPHVIQPTEYYLDSIISYGLGNFAVDPEVWQSADGAGVFSNVLEVTYSNNQFRFKEISYSSKITESNSILVNRSALPSSLQFKVEKASEIIQDQKRHLAVWDFMAKSHFESHLFKFLKLGFLLFILKIRLPILNRIKKVVNFPLIYDFLAWSEHYNVIIRQIEIEYKLDSPPDMTFKKDWDEVSRAN